MYHEIFFWIVFKGIFGIVSGIMLYLIWKYLSKKPLGMETLFDLLIKDLILTLAMSLIIFQMGLVKTLLPKRQWPMHSHFGHGNIAFSLFRICGNLILNANPSLQFRKIFVKFPSNCFDGNFGQENCQNDKTCGAMFCDSFEPFGQHRTRRPCAQSPIWRTLQKSKWRTTHLHHSLDVGTEHRGLVVDPSEVLGFFCRIWEKASCWKSKGCFTCACFPHSSCTNYFHQKKRKVEKVLCRILQKINVLRCILF